MLTPVRCLSCGLPIGDVATIFRVLAAARAREERARLDIHAPASAFVTPAYAAGTRDILDRLGIANDCCRVHLFTAMDFNDYFTRPPSSGIVRTDAGGLPVSESKMDETVDESADDADDDTHAGMAADDDTLAGLAAGMAADEADETLAGLAAGDTLAGE